jgi:hypothetical protein
VRPGEVEQTRENSVNLLHRGERQEVDLLAEPLVGVQCCQGIAETQGGLSEDHNAIAIAHLFVAPRIMWRSQVKTGLSLCASNDAATASSADKPALRAYAVTVSCVLGLTRMVAL